MTNYTLPRIPGVVETFSAELDLIGNAARSIDLLAMYCESTQDAFARAPSTGWALASLLLATHSVTHVSVDSGILGTAVRRPC